MTNLMLHVCPFIFLVVLHCYQWGRSGMGFSQAAPTCHTTGECQPVGSCDSSHCYHPVAPHLSETVNHSAVHHSDISLLRRELPFYASSLETLSAFTAIPAIRGLATAYTHQRLGTPLITRTITASSVHP